MKNLYKKMHLVMCETESLERDKKVGDGANSYKAISEMAVLNMVKPLFKKHGLIIYPTEVQVIDRVDTFSTKYGESSRLMTQVIPKWVIADIDSGESTIISSVGNGVDTQDKGSGKAMTYALKVALQKTFMMFSGEDTDNDFSEEITKAQTKKPPIDNKKLNQLVDLFGELEPKKQTATLTHYKIKDIVELPVDLWDKAITALSK